MGNFLSVSGGASQFSLQLRVGFRTLFSTRVSLSHLKMQTLQEALSSTFRISPFLPDASGSFTLNFKRLLIRPEDCGPFFPSSLCTVNALILT